MIDLALAGVVRSPGSREVSSGGPSRGEGREGGMRLLGHPESTEGPGDPADPRATSPAGGGPVARRGGARGAPEEEGSRSTTPSRGTPWPRPAGSTTGPDFPTVADDSGLEVDALPGRPGSGAGGSLRSLPGPGNGGPDRANNRYLLQRARAGLDDGPDGRFVCVAALVPGPDDGLLDHRGEVEGGSSRLRGGRGVRLRSPLPGPHRARLRPSPDPRRRKERSHRGRAFGWLRDRAEMPGRETWHG
jgi:inosine/xanthosine triphosphate pyrophosphatase family protein